MASGEVRLPPEDLVYECLRAFAVPCSIKRPDPGRELTASYCGAHGILGYLALASGRSGQGGLVVLLENGDSLPLRYFQHGVPDGLFFHFDVLPYRRMLLFHAESAERFIDEQAEELRLLLRRPLVMRFHPDVRLLEFTTEEDESYYGYVDHCADEPSSFRPFAVQLYNPLEATVSPPAAERA